MDPTRAGIRKSAIAWVLTFAVVLKFLLHAFYVPVFEGPDEPFHLARVSAFLEQPFAEAIAGREVDGSIVAAIQAHPCGPDLSRAFGCSEFAGSGAAFNILDARPTLVEAPSSPNYEAHQPMVFYSVAAVALRLAQGLWPDWKDPVSRLLMVRLLAVFLVTLALLGPMRLLSRDRGPDWATVGTLVLLAPGAAEALARCSNDAAVFLWTALLMWTLERRAPTGVLAPLVALGPLIKLTTIPVVAFALVWIGREKGLRAATLTSAAAAVFLPVQWLRGWAWGGTVELNAASSGLDEPPWELALGLGRTVYTFVKTTFWLGEWSFFRPPVFLVLAGGLLLLLWLLSLRLRTTAHSCLPLSVGLAVAAVGFLVFALHHRVYFDTWGGIGGWYLWGWFPWLLVHLHDCFTLTPQLRRVVAGMGVALLILMNIFWFATAHGIYGL